MEFLHSNYPPCKISGAHTFSEAFYDLLSETERLDIAVGYVTSDSLAELKQILEQNTRIEKMNLTIGMHYIEKFTHSAYRAACVLNRYLVSEQRGEVRLVTPFRYHGKLYSFSNSTSPFAGIIGSNNLSSILGDATRTYESSVLIDDQAAAAEMNRFIQNLVSTSTDNIADLEITDFDERNPLLEGHERVSKVDPQTLTECKDSCTQLSFEIPIKGEEKSNLNACFGKGRENKKTGIIQPRHWYEVELIVPKIVASQPGYPISKTPEAEFDVITDDGWSFRCKVSGDYNKNFRSEGDLKILGKWLKGRLEISGALTPGERVTQQTLNAYGRSTFTLTKTNKPNLWYLDFGVR
ncbi:restriction endonuclease PLD domain-containing protein [Ruminococcus albus]|uniref:NgoFVII restriction endonuclease n=1 Tax=Ruminococcus albus TaxID=1264 RepID=A0A1I1NE41_RUMAL|nr:restriction endonuclease PLD domain-containing protein [Ruminococcus albus]SFC95951.1 NgoFVII restriction endonuclease [Ruminococcus albus]